jgi:hypothetical protein
VYVHRDHHAHSLYFFLLGPAFAAAFFAASTCGTASRHTPCGGQVITTTHHVSGSGGSSSGSLSSANLLSLFLQQSIRIRALLAQSSYRLFNRLQVAYGLVIHAGFSSNRHEYLIELGLKLSLRRVLQF